MAELASALARWLVVAALGYAAVVAITHWAVRDRRLNPFGAWPRFVRRISDPVLRPLERRIVRAGGMPQSAPWWLFGLVVVGGLLLVSGVNWAIGFAYELRMLSGAGPRVWLIELVSWTFRILMFALLVRVIASWFGISPYRKWMRPVVFLTDWILGPLRRILPPFGPLDLSPLVAYFLLWVARQLVIGALV
ncbi:MAG TPA: YggT family protein [Gemmatimonadales bacterium]|nr:YggT family protein [Gemmatimonadales bacterium]